MTSDPSAHTPGAPPDVLRSIAAATGAWVWDVGADRLFGDSRFASLCGLDPELAARGAPTSAFFDAVYPEDLMRVRIAIAGMLHGADAISRDYRVKSDDGLLRWVSARARAEHDASGEVVRFGGLLIDITDQKRVEEQLRVAQTAGGVGSFEYVEGFGTVTVSEQFCRLLGLQPTTALPVRTINALVHADDPLLIDERLGPSGGAISASELRILRADTGEERWLARRGEHRRDGLIGVRFIGVIYDITTTKRTEGKLRELAHTLEQRVAERTQERDRLWNSSRDLFTVMNVRGVHKAVNPAWAGLLGYGEDDLIGQPLAALVDPSQAQVAASRIAALCQGGGDLEMDLRLRAKDGSWRSINWTLVPSGDEIYGSGRDITERTHLEDQLRQSQKMEAVGQLTGGLAHDFNNMLTGILGGMDLLRRRLAAGRYGEAERFIDAAAASAERAAALTHRLLAFSRRQTLDAQAVDANQLISSMADLLRRTLGEQVELAFEYEPDVWRTLTDANQLESALLNLAINARDAMPEGGRLTVATANVSLGAADPAASHDLSPGDYVVVSVADSGVGMTPETMAKVFDPFFTTKPIGQGTGLGLSMVYGFVRQSGGQVLVDSELGRGTTIRLYLPRLAGDLAAGAQADKPAVAPNGAGETVLLVEDDPSVRMIVMQTLNDLGYQPIEARDSQAALEVLQSDTPIDLMISDVGLPGVNGRQLADTARALRPTLPILFITGYVGNAAVRSDFLGPRMQMIAKPFAMDELALKIREVLEA